MKYVIFLLIIPFGLLDKYFPDLKPGKDYRPITPEEISRTSVFAIEIEAWSGKEKFSTE